MNKYKVAFPQMGDYSVPIRYLFTHILDCEIINVPPITNKTIELGSKYSPDFVCTPFKYTIGTFIESLDLGANILVQAGGGCRYGYYAELQEQILKDLNYDFELFNLVTAGKTNIKYIISCMQKINPKFNKIKALYYFYIAKTMIKYMDEIDDYIRQNIGFEKVHGSFERLKAKMLKSFSKTKGIFDLRKTYKKYKQAFFNIKVIKPLNPLKVGIIGELYTLMEPFSNYYLEKQLASFNMEIKRYTNVDYLLFKKAKYVKKILKKSEYVKYRMGADAADNIYHAEELCKKGYDGIIHIKSSFCTPEIGAMSIINKVCHDYNVPILFFSFDTTTSEVGIRTRLEAFHDMLEMRKKK